MSGFAEGANHVGDVITLVESTQLAGACTHSLYHQSDGTLLHIASSNGERHALAFLIYTHYHEVACTASLCDERCFNLQFEYFL